MVLCAQVITGSHDKTIKMWDLRKHTTMGTLTYHKKSVRAMAMHPRQYAFAAASAEAIKKYQLPLVRPVFARENAELREVHRSCGSLPFGSSHIHSEMI